MLLYLGNSVQYPELSGPKPGPNPYRHITNLSRIYLMDIFNQSPQFDIINNDIKLNIYT